MLTKSCLKNFIFVCGFKDTKPSFNGFLNHLSSVGKKEYYLAKKKGKLPAHFKKWRFDL